MCVCVGGGQTERERGVLFNEAIVYYNMASAVYDSNINMEKWWNDAERGKSMFAEKILR